MKGGGKGVAETTAGEEESDEGLLAAPGVNVIAPIVAAVGGAVSGSGGKDVKVGGCWGCTSKVVLRAKANWSRSAGEVVVTVMGVVEVAVVSAVEAGIRVAIVAATVPNGIGVVG